MFDQTQLDRYAEVLLWALRTSRKEPLAAGAPVLVRFDHAALPLAETVFAQLLEANCNPVLRMNMTPTMETSLYGLGRFNQLRFVPPGEEELMRGLAGGIYLLAPDSLTHLCHVNPEDIAARQLALRPLRDILDRQEELGRFGWTLALYPTKALAGHSGQSAEEYAGRIARACMLTSSDAVAKWKSIWEQAQEIKTWLTGMRIVSLRLESENIDLTVAMGEHRRWLGLTGHNVPSFEIYTSPDNRGTRGVFYADQPSFRSGNTVQGVRLVFKEGAVESLSAESGEGFALRQVSMDQGARRVGEFSLTDKRFSRIDRFMAHTLYDENFGGEHGNCHIALGMSYSDTFDGDPAILNDDLKKRLGYNVSALHWDLVNTENKVVTARLPGGGHRIIYEAGQFVL
ncbi:peptidase M29 aminopeptidase II [Desulfovibrio sp. X2]|uniref:aminopeptidase n=1 Tax=Desulfovibrio sp. X2 TaxID=941449 RepID=UPI000358B159|nr:aminopeptidase [Desulfovibrio sp. X2]EPR42361.1 peptidase M29 aminopeptidase II [Desulfovibrio sp. X2]